MIPAYNQRDVVMVEMELPTGLKETHPYLIISCRNANAKENFYSGVMMTASTHSDRYSFPVSNEMFESPLRKSGCQLRLYVIGSFRQENIKVLLSKMKKVDFKNVLEEIKDYVLLID